jgi:hypothetical protein
MGQHIVTRLASPRLPREHLFETVTVAWLCADVSVVNADCGVGGLVCLWRPTFRCDMLNGGAPHCRDQELVGRKAPVTAPQSAVASSAASAPFAAVAAIVQYAWRSGFQILLNAPSGLHRSLW